MKSEQPLLFEEEVTLKRRVWKNNPDIAREALRIGTAAEHLVCADLLLAGYRVSVAAAGLPYDLILDDGVRLYRVQVKATLSPKKMQQRPTNETPFYHFHIRIAGRKGKRKVENSDFDILALVALDIRTVAYMPMNAALKKTICLRVPGAVPMKLRRMAKPNIDQYPLNTVIGQLNGSKGSFS